MHLRSQDEEIYQQRKVLQLFRHLILSLFWEINISQSDPLKTVLKKWRNPNILFISKGSKRTSIPTNLKMEGCLLIRVLITVWGAIDLFPGSWGAPVLRTHFPWNQPPKISSVKMIMSYSSWNELISFPPSCCSINEPLLKILKRSSWIIYFYFLKLKTEKWIQPFGDTNKNSLSSRSWRSVGNLKKK